MLSDIPTLLDDISAGRMVILMDDEDRENEGDLIIAAEKVTPEIVNFFATEACGLICMPIMPERARQLNLPLMVRDNRSQHETNFTVSIDATEQVGPGSAQHSARIPFCKRWHLKPHREISNNPGIFSHWLPSRAAYSSGQAIPRPGWTWRAWRA